MHIDKQGTMQNQEAKKNDKLFKQPLMAVVAKSTTWAVGKKKQGHQSKNRSEKLVYIYAGSGDIQQFSKTKKNVGQPPSNQVKKGKHKWKSSTNTR
jgi:hypothetical protein